MDPIETPYISVSDSSTESNHYQNRPLRYSVQEALQQYFSKIGDLFVHNLYEMVLSEVEEPLLKAVMHYTRGNQSKAAIILGLSRGTLRKKLKNYGLID